jgi:enterochelin esterase-like enzyme
MEAIVVRELLPEVDTAFGTIAAREGRILEGFSMGGYGAARLGFKHPERFGDGVDHEPLPLLRGRCERCWSWYRDALAGASAPDPEGAKR